MGLIRRNFNWIGRSIAILRNRNVAGLDKTLCLVLPVEHHPESIEGHALMQRRTRCLLQTGCLSRDLPTAIWKCLKAKVCCAILSVNSHGLVKPTVP
jgi:hypothetical protein